MSSTSTSAVDLIGNVDSSNATTPLTQAPLGESDFLQIMLTQLTYQDPLKPLDNEAFIAQMAQFTTLQLQNEMNGKINTLVATQAMAQSFSLIGKLVSFNNTSANGTSTTSSGTVTTVTIQNGTPSLSISVTLPNSTVSNVSNITLADIITIADVPTSSSSTTSTPGSTGG